MENNKCDIELSPEILQFIENIARFYEAYGIPRIGGRMYGLFLVTTTPLSADQIAGLLQASRSSISTNVRALIANGWVEKVTYPGDRTEYYKFCPMAWENVLANRSKGLIPLQKIAEKAREDLSPSNPAREQLQDMSKWVNLQLQSHESMIAEWRKIKSR